MYKEIINVINLPERTDRLERFHNRISNQSEKYHIKVNNGIKVESVPFYGISLAHKSIIEDAKTRKLKQVTICEDDIVFSDDKSLEYYFKNIPSSFDMYIGGCYQFEVDNSNRMISGFSGMTLYTVSETFYDVFLSINPMNHIDRALGELCNDYEYVVCKPMVCYQENGFSDNKKDYGNYDAYLEGIELYKS